MEEEMQKKFEDRLNELKAFAKKKKNVLEPAEIADFFSDYELDDDNFDRIYEFMEQNGIDLLKIVEDDDEDDIPEEEIDLSEEEEVDETAENDLEDEDEEKEEIPLRFFIEQCVDELSVSKCIREQRIMVDMRHNPDLYLQINCISTAIPQIVRRETQYMQNMYNGFVVKDFEQIPAALDYFLGSLANWNQAKVYSYEIAQKFTTRKLLEKWKSVRAALEASD